MRRLTTMCRMLPSLHLLLVASLMLVGGASRLCAQAGIEGSVGVAGKAMGPAPDVHYALKAGQVAPSPTQLAVVYLEGSFNKAPPQKPVVMEQNGYQFSPGVLAVQTGTQIVFPNRDDDY